MLFNIILLIYFQSINQVNFGQSLFIFEHLYSYFFNFLKIRLEKRNFCANIFHSMHNRKSQMCLPFYTIVTITPAHIVWKFNQLVLKITSVSQVCTLACGSTLEKCSIVKKCSKFKPLSCCCNGPIMAADSRQMLQCFLQAFNRLLFWNFLRPLYLPEVPFFYRAVSIDLEISFLSFVNRQREDPKRLNLTNSFHVINL